MALAFEHIVVGAGISGLGMAHLSAKRGLSTLVVEGSDRVGGCVNSLTFSQCGDFWAEAGSHSCFNSYGNLVDILADLGVTERLVPKAKLSYSLWRNNARTPILSSLHPWELALSLPRLFIGSKQNKGVADFYGAGLGRRNYRDLFGPAFRAVICQEADDFPADLLFRRKPRRKEVPRSFTFPGGLSEIPKSIVSQQPNLRVQTGQRVRSVSRDNDRYRVVLADDAVLEGRWLTLAVPPDEAGALLPPGSEDLRGLLQNIGMSRIETLMLCVTTKEAEALPRLAGLIAVDDTFLSMVSRDYLPDPNYRGFAFHFRHGALDSDQQLRRSCAVLGIRQDQLTAVSTVHNQLPALRVGHQELVREIDRLLDGGNLALTGNWFLGVSIEDCLTRSRQEFERLLSN